MGLQLLLQMHQHEQPDLRLLFLAALLACHAVEDARLVAEELGGTDHAAAGVDEAPAAAPLLAFTSEPSAGKGPQHAAG